jgi:hypothetical protein
MTDLSVEGWDFLEILGLGFGTLLSLSCSMRPPIV